MTKQTPPKIAEVVLILAFCLVSVYIVLAGVVFVGTPPLRQSMNAVAQRLMSLRPCIKRNGALDEKLVLRPPSSKEIMRVIQMDDSLEGCVA
jgi:hypothetical protein